MKKDFKIYKYKKFNIYLKIQKTLNFFMKSKLFFLLIVNILYFYTSKSQIFENDFCGFESDESFKPWIGNNNFLNQYLLQNNINLDSVTYSNQLYSIPLTFWIYKTEKMPINYLEIKKFVSDLNYYYFINKTGFQFYENEIIEINNERHAIFSYFTEAPLVTTLNHKRGTANIHIIDALQKTKFKGKKVYYKGTYNSINNSIILVKLNSETGLAHEIGHFLGLKHPHNNCTKGKLRQESVSRERTRFKHFKKVKNCEVNGDCLSDTPAEPKLSNYVSENCKYQAIGVKDNWGDYYVPNTDNIMSYPTFKKCRNNFTNGQIAVMLYTAEKSKYSMFWKIDSLNNNFIDKYEPDNYIEMANVLQINIVEAHSLHKNFSLNNKNVSFDIDWFTLDIADSLQNYWLKILPEKNINSALKVSIFDKNNLLKQTENIYNDTIIKFNFDAELDNKYFIKIETKNIINYSIMFKCL